MLKAADAEIALHLKGSALLTPYGVEIRYPGDQPEPMPDEAYEAVASARKVRHAVTTRLTESH